MTYSVRLRSVVELNVYICHLSQLNKIGARRESVRYPCDELRPPRIEIREQFPGNRSEIFNFSNIEVPIIEVHVEFSE